jgi:hypothetical protein
VDAVDVPPQQLVECTSISALCGGDERLVVGAGER